MTDRFGSIMFLLSLLLWLSHWCTPGWSLFMTLTRRYEIMVFVSDALTCSLHNCNFIAWLTGDGWITYSSCYSTFQWTCEWWWNLSSREWWGLFNLHWELCQSWYYEAASRHFFCWWNSHPGIFMLCFDIIITALAIFRVTWCLSKTLVSSSVVM